MWRTPSPRAAAGDGSHVAVDQAGASLAPPVGRPTAIPPKEKKLMSHFTRAFPSPDHTRLLHTCLLVTVALAPTTLAVAQSPYGEVIAFGQSFSDNGNVYELSGGRAAASPYWGHRLSNGPLWLERLAERLQIGTPTETQQVPAPSLANGTNYAYGGAASGPGYSTTCIGQALERVCAPNMGLQVDQFLASGFVFDGDELVVLQPGGNDNSPVAEAHHITSMIVELYTAGATDFLVPNMFRLRPPGVDPMDYPQLDWFVETLDATLNQDLAILGSLLPVTIHRVDLLAVSDDLYANLGAYGFSNATMPACVDCRAGIPKPTATVVPDVAEYVFFDWVHFTTRVHRIFGDAAADAVGAPPAP